MKQILGCLALVAGLSACSSAVDKTPQASAEPQASTASGQVSGVREGDVVAYKGIPYAAAPVGDLRWQPPAEVAPWQGVRAATGYGPDCMQNPFPGDAAPLGTASAEDCLYLNVWTPAEAAAKRPVMVWIHGGGFVNGGASPAVYDGSAFARSGVVLVSFNYRLGRFGFFAHPALSEVQQGQALGNYGFMDQLAALEWVKKNIAAFGGDPENITVFGESAGGRSVNTLLVMDESLTEGLFHKAISESGGGRSRGWSDSWLNRSVAPAGYDGETAEDKGVAFAQSAGIDSSGAEALEQLRALPADAIVNGMNMADTQPATYSGPMIDGQLIKEPMGTSFREGRYRHLPYMVGANTHEFDMMSQFNPEGMASSAREFIQATSADDATIASAFALPNTEEEQLPLLGGRILSSVLFIESARFLADTLAEDGTPVWLYRFGYVADALRPQTEEAYHATEIPFIFETLADRYDDVSSRDTKVASDMHAAWVAFARSGNPADGGIDWPAYVAGSDKLLFIGDDDPAYILDPYQKRLDMIEDYLTR